MKGIAAVDTNRDGRCEKPSCAHLGVLVNRHHRGHDSLWFSAWHRFRGKPWWQKLVARYYKYLRRDIVYLCRWHHAEIHFHYDSIIAEHIADNNRPLHLFTRRQCHALQQALRAYCIRWLLLETPGMDPLRYERTKKKRRTRLRNATRRSRIS